MSSADGKPGLLVLTSTFPRWANDHEPPFVYELSLRLSRHFHVTVLAPHAPGAATEEIMDGIRVHRFRYAPQALEHLAYDGGIPHKLRSQPWRVLLVPPFLLAQTYASWRLLRRLRPRALHAHWLLPQGLVALLARRLSGVDARLLVTAHGADIHGLKSLLAQWLKRRVVADADAVSVVSRALAEEAQALTDESAKISVIPMGVDLHERFVPGPPRPRGQTLIFAGRLVEKKGVTTLLEAMALLVEQAPGCRLLIAGSGPLRESLAARAYTLEVDGHVEFLGRYRNRDLPDLLRRADIAVYPFMRAANGDQEGLGLVMLEAMGCRLPVIAGDLPAVHDVIEHMQTGLLVTPQDPVALSRAILRLIDDTELAERLAQAGHAFALANFDWQIIGDRYSDLLADKPASAP